MIFLIYFWAALGSWFGFGAVTVILLGIKNRSAVLGDLAYVFFPLPALVFACFVPAQPDINATTPARFAAMAGAR